MQASAGPDVFAAIANPVRRAILAGLRQGPRAVADLSRDFEIGRPAVSEHLQILRRAALVREEPRGRQRYYHLDLRPLTDVSIWLDSFSDYWAKRLLDLETLLDGEAGK